MTALTLYEGKQLDLIRRTVAKDCDPAEFDQFIHICKAVRLDPLRRQVYAFVFQKDKPDKRRMSIVTGIDGYRAISARTGNYRPDNRPPRITYDDAEKNPDTNPLGIVKAEVSVFQFAHGEWHEVVGEAYWSEYAPIKEVWENGRPTGKFALDKAKDSWRKMGRTMIAKCAEAQGHRRAWPDDFSGLEIQEEVDRRSIELTATELADEALVDQRVARLGGPGVLVDWCDGEPLQHVPNGKFVDAFLSFSMQHKDDPDKVALWGKRNAAAINQFWTVDKNGALEVKRVLEGIAKQVAA